MNENIRDTFDIFDAVDDLDRGVRIEVWGQHGRIHVSLINDQGSGMTVYLRQGEKLAQAILKEAWK